MNLDKSKKRIAKKAKMGFQGYPVIAITYSPAGAEVAEEEAAPMVERFPSKTDAREDEAIQSAIVKMIERSGANTVEVG